MPRLPQAPEKRYIGAGLDLLAHDLDNLRPECQLEAALETGFGVWFEPDDRDEIERRGFTPCPWCIGEDEEAQ